MDQKDRNLLGALLQNSRQPYSILAKKAGVSREAVFYRVNKLRETTIRSFFARINLSKMGYRIFECFIQLKNVSADREHEFLTFLDAHQFVSGTSLVSGRWNAIFDVMARDETHVKEIMQSIMTGMDSKIKSFMVVGNVIEQSFFSSKYWGEPSDIETKSLARNESVELDQKDRHVLYLLSQNSRIDYAEIARLVNLTPNAVRYRIRNLEKNGVIEGYTLSLDFRKLGYELHDFQLKLRNLSNVEPFLLFLKNHPRAIYYYYYFGNEPWDVDVGVIARNQEEFRSFLLELRQKFGELVDVHDIYAIFEISKEGMPKGVFELDEKENE